MGVPFTEKDLASEENLWGLYRTWKSHYTVSPRGLGAEMEARRFNVFKENVRYIHEANMKDRPFRLALNKFADMTTDEFRRTYAGSRVRHHRSLSGGRQGDGSFMYSDAEKLPAAVDWRQKGAVTAIKDQGDQCGTCICCTVHHYSFRSTYGSVCFIRLLKGAAGRSPRSRRWKASTRSGRGTLSRYRSRSSWTVITSTTMGATAGSWTTHSSSSRKTEASPPSPAIRIKASRTAVTSQR
jgi:hypothetical protein